MIAPMQHLLSLQLGIHCSQLCFPSLVLPLFCLNLLIVVGLCPLKPSLRWTMA